MTDAQVTVHADDGSARVTLHGEIDLSNARAVETEMFAALNNRLTAVSVDLTGLTYIDSAGLRILFALAKRLELLQISLDVVVSSDSVVRRVIELSGLPSQVPLRIEPA
jgi:anti-anti-sigma factor